MGAAGRTVPAPVVAEVRAWLAANGDAEGRAALGWKLVVDAGYAVPTWPTEWFGRGLDGESPTSSPRSSAGPARRAPARTHNLWANTVLAFGTDDAEGAVHPAAAARRRGDVPAVLRARAPAPTSPACRPGPSATATSGSSTARRCGRRAPREADYGMLVARTDWDVPEAPRHLVLLVPDEAARRRGPPDPPDHRRVPLQRGVPHDARVPGRPPASARSTTGWRVLQTALAYERSVMGDVARGPRSGGRGGRRRGRSTATRRAGVPAAGAEVDLAALAREHGRGRRPGDPPGASPGSTRCARSTAGTRQRAKAQLEQGSSSPILSLGKLAMSRHPPRGRPRAAAASSAPRPLLDGPTTPAATTPTSSSLNAYFTSIGGGTDQIQRNIIGERVLGRRQGARGRPRRAVPRRRQGHRHPRPR